jgi:hypothetical protein
MRLVLESPHLKLRGIFTFGLYEQNIMILFKTHCTKNLYMTAKSHYKQYALFEAWVSILLFNGKQEAWSVPLCSEYLNG